MLPKGPKFDIFRGQAGKDALWLETVIGLPQARHRMEQLASQRPGSYFVYSAPDNSIVAATDTAITHSPNPPKSKRHSI